MVQDRCFLCPKITRKYPVVLHSFPTNEDIRSLWAQACNLDINVDDLNRIYLCSNHFYPSDYVDLNARKYGGQLRLKPGTIPTVKVPNVFTVIRYDGASNSDIDSDNEHEQPQDHDATPEPNNATDEAADQTQYEGTTILNKTNNTHKRTLLRTVRYVGDLQEEDFSTPSKRSRSLDIVTRTITHLRKKLKCAQRQSYRLRTKVDTLKTLVKQLQEENSISNDAAEVLIVELT